MCKWSTVADISLAPDHNRRCRPMTLPYHVDLLNATPAASMATKAVESHYNDRRFTAEIEQISFWPYGLEPIPLADLLYQKA